MTDWESVVTTLNDRRQWLAVAESCTGGRLAAAVAAVPGASAVFRGGVVAYHRQVKEEALGVPSTMIEEHGQVSPEVAKAMAEGIRVRFMADWAIGVTGIAGPSGGTPGKPVGRIHVHIVGPASGLQLTFDLSGTREEVVSTAIVKTKENLLSLLERADG